MALDIYTTKEAGMKTLVKEVAGLVFDLVRILIIVIGIVIMIVK